MNVLAQVVGGLAVAAFLWSYQQKKRKQIILWNVISRLLYILQYFLLGAWEGAVLDILGALSSMAAQKKDRAPIQKHPMVALLLADLLIVACGLALYDNVFSLFPMVGVLLHTSAFWISNEKKIRAVSFLGSPFWLAYNLHSQAYGSALGDLLTMASIGVAICRYDLLKKAPKTQKLRSRAAFNK